MDTVEDFYAKDRQAWRAWLQANHVAKSAVWLVHDKGPVRALRWEDIVQEALCFGWIDSLQRPVSDTQNKIYMSKRKPNGGWSRINKAHVIELEEKGLMTPAGRAAIDLAKQNGMWDKFTMSDNLELSPELKKTFQANKQAKVNFDNFSSSAKRIILQWIYDAKRPETTQQRINSTIEMAAQNKKVR
jgi:uncharacterized protein YdeI (YjbR/CyaY-like superfamily)